MNIVDRAALFAISAHHGHTNAHNGEPYILHVYRVWRLCRDQGLSDEDQAVAWLHDTVEDTSVTLEDIRDLCGEEYPSIPFAVDAITKREGETIQEYYHRLCQNGSSTRVKYYGDIPDNFRRNHLIEDEETRLRMAKKYSYGLDTTREAIDNQVKTKM